MLRPHKSVWLALGLALLAVGCSESRPVDPGLAMSPEAAAYVTAALDIMEAHSINRRIIDWPAFRARTLEATRGAQTIAQTHNALSTAVRDLGDGHSSFFPPTAAGGNPLPTRVIQPFGMIRNQRIGYIQMPAYIGGDDAAHARSYHDLIASLAVESPCGWIVELRGNSGGNMWPMLAGIGPILGEGEVGGFLDPDGARFAWFYENGTAGMVENGERAFGVTVPGEAVRLPEPTPVAVLIGPVTASSGEAILVAFRGRPDTRFFGQASFGVPTGNQGFRLSDGAILNLTSVWFVDRTGVRYDRSIVPDEVVGSGAPRDAEAINVAAEWLLLQPKCGGAPHEN